MACGVVSVAMWERDAMRIVICDDEKEIRELLRDRIGRFCPQADILDYSSGKELLEAGVQPDILFLDICLPDMDGMETARRLRGKNKEMALIFVTALEEYVFQAFDVGAFHYLVKPVSEGKLQEVLGHAIERVEEKEAKKPQGEAENSWREEKSIVIKSGSISNRILLGNVIYAEVYNRKIVIYQTDGKVEYYGRMAELEKMAGEDFFRSHRAYLIHFKYVVKYDASMIWLEGGKALLSRQKYKEFVKSYLQYNKRVGGMTTLHT